MSGNNLCREKCENRMIYVAKERNCIRIVHSGLFHGDSHSLSRPFVLEINKKVVLRKASSYLKRLRYASKLVTTFRFCSYFVTSVKSAASY